MSQSSPTPDPVAWMRDALLLLGSLVEREEALSDDAYLSEDDVFALGRSEQYAKNATMLRAIAEALRASPSVRALPATTPSDGFAVRECRGHWHVTVAGVDLSLPGDPFATREAAEEACAVRAAEEKPSDTRKLMSPEHVAEILNNAKGNARATFVQGRDATAQVAAQCDALDSVWLSYRAAFEQIAKRNAAGVPPSEGSAPDRPTGFRCSFCRKQKEAVQHMVASGTAAVQICDECVQLCIGLMGLRESPPSAPDTKPDDGRALIVEAIGGSLYGWTEMQALTFRRRCHAWLSVSSSPPEGEDTQRNG